VKNKLECSKWQSWFSTFKDKAMGEMLAMLSNNIKNNAKSAIMQ
jgi:hypothetical protein